MSGIPLTITNLGSMSYAPAYQEQVMRVDELLAARDAGRPVPGYLLLVEHPPVITVSRRQGAMRHLLATPDLLAHHAVSLEETDRGGDITYHGPGQLVVYPILDLNLLNLGLHEYMRMLEGAVMATCADFGVATRRDPKATGVWVDGDTPAKICAMGVRVRKWVSMHGLALNVTTNLDHFALIVPCGLAGRGVTSLQRELGDSCPALEEVKSVLTSRLEEEVERAWSKAEGKRAGTPRA
jgi:lipoyl(octanoyl) transferase